MYEESGNGAIIIKKTYRPTLSNMYVDMRARDTRKCDDIPRMVPN
jgi:hypothetical protein